MWPTSRAVASKSTGHCYLRCGLPNPKHQPNGPGMGLLASALPVGHTYGHRLATLALALAYGHAIVAYGHSLSG